MICLKCGTNFKGYELRCIQCGLRYHGTTDRKKRIAVYSLDRKALFIEVPYSTLAVFNWEPI